MPEQVQCPSCKQKLRVPDNLLGKKVKCPKCATIFEAKVEESKGEDDGGSYGFTQEPEPKPRSKALRRAAGEEIEDEDDDEEPVRTRRSSSDQDEEDEEEDQDDEEPQPKKKKNAKRVRRNRAMDRIWAPAVGLQVTAGLGIAAVVLNLVFIIIGLTMARAPQAAGQQFVGPNPGVLVGQGVGTLISLLIQVAVLNGASKMKRLESFREATILSILCMLPCTCCFLGLPFGIWSLVVINSSDVRPYFKA